ncbi:hypothetical protein JHK87_052681 [Glycine soja]|nr:hypothetical protein JHK87_052681 [Glycine soja]
MKTISGHCVPVKDISVLKVAKILTKFVSADNDTSHKHKRHTTENGNDSGKVVGNSVQSVDINKELSLGHVKFDQFKRQQSGSGNADGENFSQQLDGFIGYESENVDGGEMHKKKKKKKQEVESLHNIDSTIKFGVREADGKHVSSRNPRIEKGSSMLDNLVGSLDLPKAGVDTVEIEWLLKTVEELCAGAEKLSQGNDLLAKGVDGFFEAVMTSRDTLLSSVRFDKTVNDRSPGRNRDMQLVH